MSKVMDVKEKDGKFYAYYLNLKKKGKKNCDFISVGKKMMEILFFFFFLFFFQKIPKVPKVKKVKIPSEKKERKKSDKEKKPRKSSRYVYCQM